MRQWRIYRKRLTERQLFPRWSDSGADSVGFASEGRGGRDGGQAGGGQRADGVIATGKYRRRAGERDRDGRSAGGEERKRKSKEEKKGG